MAKKTLIALILIFFNANFIGVLSAGQAARQYAIGYLNAQRVYSPDEKQLANYLVQRSEILKSLPKSKSPSTLKHQLKILNGKITYIENEIDRNRKISVPKKTKAVHQTPPVKKASLPPKIKTRPEPPRILETRPLRAPEAKTLPPLAPLKKPLRPEGHEVYRFENPARAPVFNQVQLSSPQVLAIPQPVISQPKMIESATSVSAFSAGPDIQLSHAAVIKPNIQNIQISSVQAAPVQTTRPIFVATTKIEGIEPVITPRIPETKVPSARNMTAPSPVAATAPPRTVEFQKAEPPVLTAAQAVSEPMTAAPIEIPSKAVVPTEPAELISPVQTEAPVALKGTDWAAMPRDEKEMYVFSAMGALVKHDVVSMKPSYFYIQALDDMLEKNPSQKDQFLDDIFISSIYQNEPDTRSAIDKIRR